MNKTNSSPSTRNAKVQVIDGQQLRWDKTIDFQTYNSELKITNYIFDSPITITNLTVNGDLHFENCIFKAALQIVAAKISGNVYVSGEMGQPNAPRKQPDEPNEPQVPHLLDPYNDESAVVFTCSLIGGNLIAALTGENGVNAKPSNPGIIRLKETKIRQRIRLRLSQSITAQMIGSTCTMIEIEADETCHIGIYYSKLRMLIPKNSIGSIDVRSTEMSALDVSSGVAIESISISNCESGPMISVWGNSKLDKLFLYRSTLLGLSATNSSSGNDNNNSPESPTIGKIEASHCDIRGDVYFINLLARGTWAFIECKIGRINVKAIQWIQKENSANASNDNQTEFGLNLIGSAVVNSISLADIELFGDIIADETIVGGNVTLDNIRR